MQAVVSGPHLKVMTTRKRKIYKTATLLKRTHVRKSSVVKCIPFEYLNNNLQQLASLLFYTSRGPRWSHFLIARHVTKGPSWAHICVGGEGKRQGQQI